MLASILSLSKCIWSRKNRWTPPNETSRANQPDRRCDPARHVARAGGVVSAQHRCEGTAVRRGRKIGALQNARDERGWMIPREGTLRRAIYDAMVANEGPAAVRQRLNLSGAAYAQHRSVIVNWGTINARRRAAEGES